MVVVISNFTFDKSRRAIIQVTTTSSYEKTIIMKSNVNMDPGARDPFGNPTLIAPCGDRTQRRSGGKEPKKRCARLPMIRLVRPAGCQCQWHASALRRGGTRYAAAAALACRFPIVVHHIIFLSLDQNCGATQHWCVELKSATI